MLYIRSVSLLGRSIAPSHPPVARDLPASGTAARAARGRNWGSRPRLGEPGPRFSGPIACGNAAGGRRRRDVHRRGARRRRADCTRRRRRRRPTTSRGGDRGDRGGARARPAPTPAAVEVFAHGMTVGTNALLEERGARPRWSPPRASPTCSRSPARTGPRLYRLCAPKPAPLVAGELRFEAARADRPRGRRRAARRRRGRADRRRGRGRRAPSRSRSACCSPTSTPTHERAIAERLRAALPGRPRLRLARGAAAVPRVRALLDDGDRRLPLPPARPLPRPARARRRAERGLPEPMVMQSSGGVAPAAEAARAGAWSVLSGPAGGAVGAGLLARPRATATRSASTWAAPPATSAWSRTGRVRRTDSRELAGRVIQLPMVDVHTVGAGGGSIGWRDAGGALRVGPRSAGAEPGPACYGRGGDEPTVTDANLALGYLGAGLALAGGVELDLEAAARGDREARRGARARGARGRRGDRPGRQQRDGAGAAGGHRRARRRPAPVSR